VHKRQTATNVLPRAPRPRGVQLGRHMLTQMLQGILALGLNCQSYNTHLSHHTSQ